MAVKIVIMSRPPMIVLMAILEVMTVAIAEVLIAMRVLLVTMC